MAKGQSIRASCAGWLWGALAVLMVALLLGNPALATESIRRGMLICTRTMIPSLFPFMVVSEWIVRSGVGEHLAKCLSWLLAPLFGLPREGITAVLIGWLCGFPVGARVASSYAARGRLTKREFQLVLAVANVPSAAFLVSAVGVSLFGSAAVGRVLITLSLLAALISGCCFRLWLPRGGQWALTKASLLPKKETEDSAGALLTGSIAAAASSMLNVCATVLLFCALIGTLNGVLELLSVGEAVRASIVGVFELSNGVCAASALPDSTIAAVLCAAMAGWGGLSIHCQVLAVCEGQRVSMGFFWLSRAIQALLCGGGMAILIAHGCVEIPTMPEPMAWRDLLIGVARPMTGVSFAHIWSAVCMIAFGFAMVIWGAGKLCTARKEKMER